MERYSRKHSIEEKRERSKRRKQAKKKNKKSHGTPHTEIVEKETNNVASHTAADYKDGKYSSLPFKSDQTVCNTGNDAIPGTSGVEHNNSDEQERMDAARYKKHAVVFYSKWKQSERFNVPELKESDLDVTDKEIGRGSFGRCVYGRFGQLEVVIKKVGVTGDSLLESKEEVRLLNRLRHPHISILVGYLEKATELWIVTRFHSYEGKSLCLSEATESKCLGQDFRVYLCCLIQICSALDYLHRSAKVLHNDIKENNAVLEAPLTPYELPQATLIDFGKAKDVFNPKTYHKGANVNKYKHLAPELAFPGGKQSTASDVYSFGYVLQCVSIKLEDMQLQNVYSACMRNNSKKRPEISNVYKALKRL